MKIIKSAKKSVLQSIKNVLKSDQLFCKYLANNGQI